MAEIVQLKNETGTQVYPVTTGEAIYFSGGKNLDLKLSENEDSMREFIYAKMKEMYPVGSVYISFGDDSPASFIPGTRWQQLSDGHWLRASSTASNTPVSPGLPNITGWFRIGKAGGYGNGSDAGGAFSVENSGQGNTATTTSNGTTVYFDASDSSSVYGRVTDEVRPKSYKVKMWKRIAD